VTHDDLGKKLLQLSLEGYTENTTFSFHKGSLCILNLEKR
jgi:hypothetical protein